MIFKAVFERLQPLTGLGSLPALKPRRVSRCRTAEEGRCRCCRARTAKLTAIRIRATIRRRSTRHSRPGLITRCEARCSMRGIRRLGAVGVGRVSALTDAGLSVIGRNAVRLGGLCLSGSPGGAVRRGWSGCRGQSGSWAHFCEHVLGLKPVHTETGPCMSGFPTAAPSRLHDKPGQGWQQFPRQAATHAVLPSATAEFLAVWRG